MKCVKRLCRWLGISRKDNLKLSLAVGRLFRRAMTLATAIDVYNERLRRVQYSPLHPKFLKGFKHMSADLQQEIEAITQATEVIESALVLVRSIPSLIADATAAALANGATAEQLQPLSDLSTLLATKAQELAQAVIDNTPAGPPVDPPTDPEVPTEG